MARAPADPILPWLPLASALLTALLVFCAFELLRIVGLRRLRRAAAGREEIHWTERARLGFGARRQVGLLLLLVLVAAALGHWGLSTGPLSATSPLCNGAVATLLSLGASLLALRRFGRDLGLPATSFADDVRGHLFLLRFVLFAVFWVTGFALFGSALFEGEGAGAYLLALGSLAVPFVVLPLSFRLLRLWVEDEELARRLAPLFERAGVAPRRVERLEIAMPNAFAFPLSRRVAVTRGLLETLSPEEVEAVVAHELGHLREGRKALVRWLPLGGVAVWALTEPLHPSFTFSLTAFAMSFFALFTLTRIVSRRFERHADEAATELVDGAVYARALEKLHERNLIPAVLSRSATHPSLYERVEKAGVAPTYPRPAPPLRGNPLLLLGGVLLAGLGSGLGVLVPWAVEQSMDDGTYDRLLAVMSAPAGPRAVSRLAASAHRAGDLEGAVALGRLAAESEPQSPWHEMNLSFSLAAAGRCAEADVALRRAWSLSSRDERVLEHLPERLRCRPDGSFVDAASARDEP